MIKRIEYIKDVVGNNFLGVKYSQDELKPFLADLREELESDEEYNHYTGNILKTNGYFHIEVVNTMALNIAISKNPNDATQQIERLFNYDIDDIKLLGLGKIEKDTNVVFYIMVDSLKLDAILKVFNLESNGFFINIGYKYTDIYDRPKNTILEKTSKFRQLLASEYYNNENWNFIYDIENFDAPRLNEYTEIIPLEITDNILRVKYTNLILDITWLENKFWIVAEYPVEKEYNKMTKSKIDKLLKWKKY